MPGKRSQLRGRSNQRIETPQSYLFRIEQVDPHYSFGINVSAIRDGFWSEYMHHQFLAVCLAPAKFAGRRTQFTIIGDRQLIGRADNEPLAVGRLKMRGEHSEYLGSLPFDAAQIVPILALVEGYRFILLSGDQTRNGSARIRHMGFYRELDPDDF